MKINSVYIEAFGKCKKLKIDFNNGFNVVYGENENGKTTVMSFIKMMFYGSERSTASKAMNTRKKYTPWDSAQMAGSIDFEHAGKKYRLEKEFKGSNSTDKTVLCDLGLGERQTVASDVGSKFFGLSLAAFERSVFIGQLGYPENDANAEGEINSRLSNITLTGDQSISFDAVNARIQKAKLALMSKSGRAGVYDKNKALCLELEQKIEKAQENTRLLEKQRAAITLLEQGVAKDAVNVKALKEQIDAEQDIRNAEKLSQYLELKAKLDKLNQTLMLEDGSVLDEMYLSKLKFCISKMQTAENKTKAKLAERDTLRRSIEAGLNPPSDASQETAERLTAEIAKAKADKQTVEKQIAEQKAALQSGKTAKINPVLFLILGILCMGLVAVLAVVTKLYLPAGILAAVGALSLIVLTVLKSALKKEEAQKQAIIAETAKLKAKEEKLQEQIFKKTVKLETVTAALNSSAAVIENQQKMLAEINGELEALKAAESEETKALFALFAKYKKALSTDEIEAAIDVLSEKSAAQKQLKQQLSFIAKDLGGISYSQAKQKLEKIDTKGESDVDFGALKAKYEELLAAISEKRSQIATLTAEAKAMLAHTQNPETLKKQLKEVSEKAAAQKEFCDAADVAMEILLDSFAEIRQSYGSVLETKAAEIFARLTGGKYGSMTVSKTFQIGISQTDVFGNREIDFLSSGTVDQAYLSLRLALSQLMCENSEQLPLLLDDALTQYDDTRAAAALQFLSEYAKQTQIIMFTCHKQIADSAKLKGANIIEL